MSNENKIFTFIVDKCISWSHLAKHSISNLALPTATSTPLKEKITGMTNLMNYRK